MAPTVIQTPIIPGPTSIATATPGLTKLTSEDLTALLALDEEENAKEALPVILTGHVKPLKYSGSLDRFASFDVTPVIGREFPEFDLVELLEGEDDEVMLRDLAITISERGVVFFRNQHRLTEPLQKKLVQRLGELSGKPTDSTLHIHPLLNASTGAHPDNEISIISSEQNRRLFINRHLGQTKRQSAKSQWHSDITFEKAPSDYALLRLTELPETGGDTLWASGYELYDRLSRSVQRWLETLTATYAQPAFNRAATDAGLPIYTEARGSPLNVGSNLSATHPVVRTNPVTGWKSVFAVGHHVSHINGLTEEESRGLLEWFVRLVVENHDLQVRLKWKGKNDVAIWDNRVVYHAATPDYAGIGERRGVRVVGIGERPYLDEGSTGRREGLRKRLVEEARRQAEVGK